MDSDTVALTAGLLAGAERCDLPALTREELLASGARLDHPDDRAWLEHLSDRERALLGDAGLRSLVARGLVVLRETTAEAVDELVVTLAAIRFATQVVLLSQRDEAVEVLCRRVPESDAYLVASTVHGLHRHALVTRAAAVRECSSWLLGGTEGGPERAAAVGSGSGGAQLTVVRTPEGPERVLPDGTTSAVTADELHAWLQERMPRGD